MTKQILAELADLYYKHTENGVKSPVLKEIKRILDTNRG